MHHKPQKNAMFEPSALVVLANYYPWGAAEKLREEAHRENPCLLHCLLRPCTKQ